ncbi:S8 family serine peptidase [Burkholderia cepacia]|uniref:S8 family serine peptidase n=1 Tax=Burkholderia cepacia TaxID=292 RepID=UPI00158C1D84|nr:S8 family serine peptidase [Burkholderia cepacia]
MSEQSKRYMVLARTIEETAFQGPFAQSGRRHGALRSFLNKAFPDGAQIPVTSSLVDNDAAVLELTDEQARAFREANTDVALHPVRSYRLAAVDMDLALMELGPFDFGAAALPSPAPFKIKVCDAKGQPIAKAAVTLKESGTNRVHKCVTSRNGRATVSSTNGRADFIRVAPASGYWDEFRRGVTASEGTVSFTLQSLTPATSDCLKYHCSQALAQSVYQPGDEQIKVAVIDTGVDRHCDLTNVSSRTAYTQADDENDTGDNGTGHGTHVAGIIGANGVARGLAPNAELISMRVFERDSGATDSACVYDAIMAAIQAGVDVINLSLGQEHEDAVLQVAIEDAEAAGILVVAASGNEGSNVPQYPAAYSSVVSVAALGRRGAFPENSSHAQQRARAIGTDTDDFVPVFSNWGKIDLAAPGVAVISTIGTSGYTAMDGTSMACPVVAGLAARLLESSPALKGRQRSPERLADLKRLLHDQCRLLGFQEPDVGKGLPYMGGGTS